MSITKENKLQAQINELKRRINCLCQAINVLEQGVGDGNGIYGGSGIVPGATTASVTTDFNIIGANINAEFVVEMGDAVDDLTELSLTPTSAYLQHAQTATTSIVKVSETNGVELQQVVGLNTYQIKIDATGNITVTPVSTTTLDGTVIVSNTALIDSTPSADLTVKGITAQFAANENQGFGDAVFINSTSEAQLGDASVVATASCIGLCTGTVTTGNTGTYLLQGFARKDAWNWTVGAPIYLSLTGTTTNTLTQTKPSATNEVVQILGWAVTADVIYWNPSLVQIEIA